MYTKRTFRCECQYVSSLQKMSNNCLVTSLLARLQSITYNEQDYTCVHFCLYKHLVSDCGLPKQFPNGVISFKETTNTSNAVMAEVRCNTGYEPSTPVITCTTSGMWGNASCNAIGVYDYFHPFCITMIWKLYHMMLGFEIS